MTNGFVLDQKIIKESVVIMLDKGTKERTKSKRMDNEWHPTPNHLIFEKELNKTMSKLYLIGVLN